MTDRRYPIGPLADAMHCSPRTALGRLGISGTTYQAHLDHGVSHLVADRLAVRSGFHPYQIWPWMLDDDIADTAHLPDIDETPAEARRRRKRETHAQLTAERRAA